MMNSRDERLLFVGGFWGVPWVHRLLSEEACSSQWHAVETGMLGRALLRQPANHSGDIVSMTPTRSSDPAFEELVLARAEEGRDRWRRWHRQLAYSASVGQGGRPLAGSEGKAWRERRAWMAGNACPAGGTVAGRASFAGGHVAVWLCAALCDGVARQTGHEMQFCSQLVVASAMIGRLCKVLWSCAVQRWRARRANEDEEGVSQGGRSGMQSTHASATLEGGRMED